MNTQLKIEKKLRTYFNVHVLNIIDESHKHVNHKKDTNGGHFKLLIVSNDFDNISLIKRHQLIYSILNEEMKKIHAIAIHPFTPEEWKEKRNILVVTPASLMGNFYDELRSQCTGDEYVTPKDRKILGEANPSSDKYLQIIKKINKKIDKFYSVLSYNKFVDKLKRKKINFEKTLLIIDINY